MVGIRSYDHRQSGFAGCVGYLEGRPISTFIVPGSIRTCISIHFMHKEVHAHSFYRRHTTLLLWLLALNIQERRQFLVVWQDNR